MATIPTVQDDIESIISSYCDGTWNGLEDAHFIEYGDNYSPKKCANEIVKYITDNFPIYFDDEQGV